MKSFPLALLVLLAPLPALAQEKATPEQLEFFEAKVRPVLVQHCFECHSAKAKKLKGGLLLDSRAGMLAGGDLGPALVPGEPDKTRFLEAISHKNLKLKMPQKYKLPDAVIADLTAWVKMGTPWPDEKFVKKNPYTDFDLAKRKAEHWCWQPIRAEQPPSVKDTAWATSDVDRFLLAKLEAKGLKPAPPAEPRVLLRRLHFDLIGLPPSRDEVEEFVKAWETAGAKRGVVVEQVVDRLLDSPQFGERWARHWLDLVRYAESRGHEFDYTIPNAHHYRDYVIRAFNSDVPYNQLVREHVAGDLLASPRMHKDGFNESILGTAFWFLGEECHSPVDIRQDQADRFDNRIDVLTKTFLGLTVSCARCHDHKFDAISTKDYYALFGILESSNYRLARFDTITQHRKIAHDLAKLRDDHRRTLLEAMQRAAAPNLAKIEAYLAAAYRGEKKAAGLDVDLLDGWRRALDRAGKDENSPLHVFAKNASEPQRPFRETCDALLKRWPNTPALDLAGADVVVDYRNHREQDWLADDAAFGVRAARTGDVFLSEFPLMPIARVVEHSAAERQRIWGNRSSGSQNESGALGGAIRAGQTLRTPEFTIKEGRAHVLVKGTGMIYAAVAQHIMLSGPLHGSLVQRFNTSDKFQWVTVNLTPYKGQRTHLEFTPSGDGEFAVVAVVQGANAPSSLPANSNRWFVGELGKADSVGAAAKVLRDNLDLRDGVSDPRQAWLQNWMVQNFSLFVVPDSAEAKALIEKSSDIVLQNRRLLMDIKPISRLTPAMQDGSGTDEHVFIRGNPRTPGDAVPRRFLEALAGPKGMPIKSGSGRLELAEAMVDPALTPHISRVYVNRVWHHLFGRGIVGSVDNFGVLGEAPTHPELLDYLAREFTSPGMSAAIPGGEPGLNWSTKKLIRKLVLTRAYQMSSQPDAKADEADPQNLLLHRARLRRLEGEAIRDSILKVSGRLNATMYGPSIPVFLTPFQDGRGKPASGPLDGDGRRSVYLAVRRNFLSSFLLAFDTPAPFSTVGRRTVSNVPAQALILMNDPFVHQQADLWAKRVMSEKASDEQRLRGMYVDAFARPPSEAELRACTGFLGAAPDQRRWADLAHVLINAKEFYFVN
jgi:mono/diheme cytochrome c family protein